MDDINQITQDPQWQSLPFEERRKVLADQDASFKSLDDFNQRTVLSHLKDEADKDKPMPWFYKKMGISPSQLEQWNGYGAQKTSDSKHALASLASMVPGIAGESLLTPAISRLSPLGQGLSRSAVAEFFGNMGGQMTQNAFEGQPITQDVLPHDKMSAISHGLSILGPLGAGIFANLGSKNLEAQSLHLGDQLEKTTGINPLEARSRSLSEMSDPLQQEFQLRTSADNMGEAHTLQAQKVVDAQVAKLNAQRELSKAQADLDYATSTGNAALQQDAKTRINALQTDAAQRATDNSQVYADYIQSRNQIEDKLDEMEKKLGKAKAQKRKEYQNARRTLDQMGRGQDLEAARQSIVTNDLRQDSVAAKQAPVKLDQTALEKMPEAQNVSGLKNLVQDTKFNAAQEQLALKSLRLKADTTLDPAVAQADPAARQILKDLGSTKLDSVSAESFQNKLLDPHYLRVAQAAIPEQKQALDSLVLTTMLQKAYSNGHLDPKAIQDVFLGKNGQGMETLRLIVGQTAQDSQPLERTIQEFADFCSSKPSTMFRVLHTGAHTAMYLGLVGLGEEIATNGATTNALAPAAAVAGTALGAVVATDQFAKLFFTMPAFREGAMAWAKSGKVGQSASKAATIFAGAVRAMSQGASPQAIQSGIGSQTAASQPQ